MRRVAVVVVSSVALTAAAAVQARSVGWSGSGAATDLARLRALA